MIEQFVMADMNNMTLSVDDIVGIATSTISQGIISGDIAIGTTYQEEIDALNYKNKCQEAVNDMLMGEIRSLKKIMSNISTQLYTHIGEHQKEMTNGIHND